MRTRDWVRAIVSSEMGETGEAPWWLNVKRGIKFVERQETYSPQLLHYLRQKFEPFRGQKIDAVVLGCTHFPFVRKAIQEVVGRDVILYDSAMGVGRQVKRQLEAHELLNTSGKRGQVTIINSKGEEGVKLCEELLYN